MPAKVLVTDGEQRAALAITRSLGRAGYEVHVAGGRAHSIAGASRYADGKHRVSDPLQSPEAYLEDISALLAKLGIGVMIPVTEASLRILLPARSRWPDVVIPFPSAEAFARLSDKAAVLDAARALGIATPKETRLDDPGELLEASPAFPLAIKPARSVFGNSRGMLRLGVSYARSQDELIRKVESFPAEAYPLLLQERIVGEGIGVFLLRDQGETLASFFHRRIREKPPSGGVSVYAESVAPDPSLLRTTEQLLDRFGWSGVAMAEFKRDHASGVPYLMEVNARFWGSLQLAIDCGVDFPRLLVNLALRGIRERVAGYTVGRRLRWWWGDVDHLLLRLRRSPEALGLPPSSPSRLAAVSGFLSSSGREEVLRRDDPRPFIRETLDWLAGR